MNAMRHDRRDFARQNWSVREVALTLCLMLTPILTAAATYYWG